MQTAHRFSETSFRNYEPEWLRVQQYWPTPVSFDPAQKTLGRVKGISIETYTCRLRDALHGYIRHNYTSETLDRTKIEAIYQKVVVAQRDGLVVVGPHSALKSYNAVAPVCTVVQGRHNEVYEVIAPSLDVLRAFCLLLSERLLDKPLLCHTIDPQHLMQLQEEYDIVATLQEDRSTLIV